jgi:hypothetical protein
MLIKKLLIIGVALPARALAAAIWGSSSGATTVRHVHPPASSTAVPQELAPLVANARFATRKYAFNLNRAKRHGYTTFVTQHIPDMGWHFLNPNITEFDVTKPPILVYVKRDHRWQLVAFEWVFTERPATDPLPAAQYGSFPAACHYVDGTFVPRPTQADCPRRSPVSGAKSGSGTPTWSPCTSGCGTRIRTGSTPA